MHRLQIWSNIRVHFQSCLCPLVEVSPISFLALFCFAFREIPDSSAAKCSTLFTSYYSFCLLFDAEQVQ